MASAAKDPPPREQVDDDEEQEEEEEEKTVEECEELILAAIKANSVEDLEEALTHTNANVNFKDKNDWTPILLAAANGQEEIIRVLIKN